MRKIGFSELRKTFASMPEFLGRIDSTVVFNDLNRPSYERIFDKFIDEINEDQRYGQNFLAVTSELRNFILDHAEIGEYGAREIRHRIDQYLIDKASEIKASGVLKEGQPLVGDLEDNQVIFWTSDLNLQPEPKLLIMGGKNGDNPSVFSEEAEGEEEAPPEETPQEKMEKKLGHVTMYLPHEPGGATIDLMIAVKQPGQTNLNQIVTGLPLLPDHE